MKLANWFARLAYLCTALLLLQVISLFVILFIQYMPLSAEQPQKNTANKLSVAVERAFTPLPESPSEIHPLVTIFAWLLLIAVCALIAIYSGKIMSALVKNGVKKFVGKVDTNRLFAAKFILIGVIFTILILQSLLLPFMNALVPLNTLLTLTAYICCCIQLYIVHRNKTPLVDVL